MDGDEVQSEDDLARGIHVTPGPGIVARLGNFVAFARGDEDGLNQLIVRLNALADARWPEVVRTLTSDIAAAGYEAHPQLACASILPDKVGALVFGDLKLMVTTDLEERVLDGSDSSTWIDVAVHGEAHRLRCGEQSASAVVGVLRDGVVPAGGFVLDRHGPIPAATRWDHHAFEDDSEPDPAADAAPQLRAVPDEDEALVSRAADEDEVEGFDESGDVEVADATEAFVETVDERIDAISDDSAIADADVLEAQVVEIVEEPTDGDAAADPSTESEVVTGSFFSRPGEVGGRQAVAHDLDADLLVEDPPPQPDPLPPPPALDPDSLGVLTFDDGAQLQLVRPVVIGRGVPEHYMINGIAATTVLLDDAQGLISPVHLEVHLVGDDVQLLDMDSPNGTFIRSDGDSYERTRISPDEPTVIRPGTVVEMGYRSFTFTA